MNRPLSILLLFLFFHAYFFYESQALHRQLCSGMCYFLVTTLLVLHMLFFGVFASNYTLFGGGQTSKNAFNRKLRYFMVVSGVHSSIVVFNACVYSSMYLFAVCRFCDKWVDFRGGDAVQQCVCVCFLPIHSGHQDRWTYQPGSHRRKVTQDFSSTFFLRFVPSFFSREGFSHSFPSSTAKSNFVY